MRDTWLHQRHPLVQMTTLIGAGATALLCTHVWGLVGMVVLHLMLLWVAGLAPWRLPGRWACLSLGFSLIAIHVLIVRSGPRVLGPITATGLHQGVIAAGRVVTLILAGRLFALTTNPANLAQVLIRLGLPYRWAYAGIAALRLEPLFSQEARALYWAQSVRGVRYRQGPLWRRWLMFRRLLMSLLVSALRTARDLSGVMENRCFGRYRKRTSLYILRFGMADALTLMAWLTLFIILVLLP